MNQASRRTGWGGNAGCRFVFWSLFVLGWLLILPLPGPLERVRNRWYAAGSGNADAAEGQSHFFDTARGTVSLSGPAGNWRMQVHSCVSGEHRGFYGVSLAEDNPPNTVLRVVQPEDGSDHLTLSSADGSLQVMSKADCSVWDVFLKEGGGSHNVSYVVAGHARFACTFRVQQGRFAAMFRLAAATESKRDRLGIDAPR